MLPVTLWLEMEDILFLIRLLVDPPNDFHPEQYISHVSSFTRASYLNKIKCTSSLTPHINVPKQFYFNRVVRIWNSLPHIDTDRSYLSIKRLVLSIFWQYFLYSYSVDNPCSWYVACPCANCSCLPNSSLNLLNFITSQAWL